jgi:hypothetical protein
MFLIFVGGVSAMREKMDLTVAQREKRCQTTCCVIHTRIYFEIEHGWGD